MPRNRMIKPDFWDDEKLATQTSRDARLVFIALWNFSDDYGVVKGNAMWLKNHVFPYEDSLSIQKFSGWLSELSSGGWIVPFEHAGEQYFFIRTFEKHQTINRPSAQRNPQPPEGVSDAIIKGSLTAHGVLDDDSCPKYKRSIKEMKTNMRDDDFEKFWTEYPNKKSKQVAKKSWDSLCKEKILPPIDTLLFSLSEQKESKAWKKDGGEFVPHPSTWLNQHRWNDEVVPFVANEPQPEEYRITTPVFSKAMIAE
jgi:hypothetical protein